MKNPVVTENEAVVKDDAPEVVLDDDAELAPLRHFHRIIQDRDLRTGPTANPRRTRLI